MNSFSEEFPELFHYTTLAGLKGILQSRTLWATHFQDLNDSQELLAWKPIAIEQFRPTVNKFFESRYQTDHEFSALVDAAGGLPTLVEKETHMHIRIIDQQTFGMNGLSGPFVCSFCCHKSDNEKLHGLLSQWRGYGDDGGVSIVFDTNMLEKAAQKEQQIYLHTKSFARNIVYTDDFIRVSADPFFNKFNKYLNAFHCYDEKVALNALEAVVEPLIELCCSTKHWGFREENEVRVVVFPRPTDPNSMFYDQHDGVSDKPIKLRKQRCGEARYIELFDRQTSEPLPINRIIIGPSRWQSVHFQEVQNIVKEFGLDINVTCSEIPFLG